MKRLILLFLLLSSTIFVVAQNEGNYRSVINGGWSNPHNWQRYTHGKWEEAGSSPGENDIVYIESVITTEPGQNFGYYVGIASYGELICDNASNSNILENFGTLAGKLTNGGTLNLNGVNLYAEILNRSNLYIKGSIGQGVATITNEGTIYDVSEKDTMIISCKIKNTFNGIYLKQSNKFTNFQGTFENEGTLDIRSGIFEVGPGGILNKPGGSIYYSPGSILRINFVGGLTLEDRSVLSGGGSLEMMGYWVINIPAFSIPLGANVSIVNGTVDGTGSIEVHGTLNYIGPNTKVYIPVEVAPAGNLNFLSNVRIGDNSLVNRGSVYWQEGNISVTTYPFINQGQFIIRSSGNYAIASSYFNTFFENSGSIVKLGGSANLFDVVLINKAGGRVAGSGKFSFYQFENRGRISPGQSPGLLQLQTNSSIFTDSSNLDMEIQDGSGAGTGHDQLQLEGNQEMKGVLNITETGSAPPGNYTLLSTTGTLSGRFKIRKPDQYTVSVNNNSVVATKLAAVPDSLRRPGSGNALQFDGIDDCVNLGMASLNLTDEFTVSFNFRLSGLPQTGKLFSLISKSSYPATSITDFPFSINISDDGKLYAFFSKGDDYTRDALLASSAPVAINRWYKVSVVYRHGDFAALYLDGFEEQRLSIPFSISSNNQPWFLGRMSQEVGAGVQTTQFQGSLDELTLWQTALTETQIRDWMCRKTTVEHPVYDKLVAYYRFDESEGPVLTDRKGLNDGTLQNGPTFIVSGAALGDKAVYSLGTAASATLAHEQGESLTATVTNTSGPQSGVYVYLVNEKPATLKGAAGTGGNDRYFGVWLAGGATSYDAVYRYAGNPHITSAAEGGLHLFSRTDNSGDQWSDANAVLNTTGKTLTVSGAHTEYILGSTATVLPLQLLSFNLSRVNEQVQLSWTVSQQDMASPFIVERSSLGSDYTVIGRADGIANLQDRQTYHFTDLHPLQTTSYYRLQWIDKSGKKNYSPVVRLLPEKAAVRFGLYPNPAASQVMVTGLQPGKLSKIELHDASGRLLRSEPVVYSNMSMDLSQLSPGAYFIRYFDGTNWQALHFVHR